VTTGLAESNGKCLKAKYVNNTISKAITSPYTHGVILGPLKSYLIAKQQWLLKTRHLGCEVSYALH